MKVVLHLGVHKTATTHFQSRLFNSKKKLEESGVCYFGLDETRALITSRIGSDDDLYKSIVPKVKGCKKLLISDENIIGGTEKIHSPLIYPDVEPRLKFLLNAIPVELDSVHITIRDPESYLISRYSEYLRHYGFMSVLKYFDEFDIKNFSWMPLVNKIEEVTGKQVHITPFENLFDNEEVYLKNLVQEDIDFNPASSGAAIRRSKISYESYRILENLADDFPKHMTKRLMNMMDNNKQKTKPSAFKPFSQGLLSQLKENYQTDKAFFGLA